MYKHVYKLKMTVNGTEYFAPITWTSTLDLAFNGRSKRISERDYPNSSTKTTLSEYLTNGIGLTNDSVIPAFAKKTNFSWKGYQNTDYTNISGPINKVTLMSENITNGSDFLSRTNNNLFYKDGIDTLSGQSHFYISGFEDGHTYTAYQDKDNNILCSNSLGLDGEIEGDGFSFVKGYLDDFKFSLGSSSVQKRTTDFNLNYSNSIYFNKDDIELSNDDIATLLGYEQEYQEIPYPETPDSHYSVYNCFVISNVKNLSVAQNNDYIFIYYNFSYGELSDICDYRSTNNKPAGYTYYVRNGAFETPMSFEMCPYIFYTIIDKETLEAVYSGITAVDKTYTVYLKTGQGVQTTPDNSYKYRAITSSNATTGSNIIFYDFIFTMDDTKIYAVNGNTKTKNYTELVSFDLSDFMSDNPPASVTPTVINTNDIYEFCHTIIRMNLFVTPFWNPAYSNYYYTHSEDRLNSTDNAQIINNETGLWNWHGFVDWLVSGYADFGGVNVPAGATVRFELVEQIIEEN